jgi:hypothetical protein
MLRDRHIFIPSPEMKVESYFILKVLLICGLVVRVPGYRPRGSGFDSRRYHIFWVSVGLERGPLSLVRINKELLERKVAAPV